MSSQQLKNIRTDVVSVKTSYDDSDKVSWCRFADIREYKTTQEHDLDLAAGRVDALFAQSTALAKPIQMSQEFCRPYAALAAPQWRKVFQPAPRAPGVPGSPPVRPLARRVASGRRGW